MRVLKVVQCVIFFICITDLNGMERVVINLSEVKSPSSEISRTTQTKTSGKAVLQVDAQKKVENSAQANEPVIMDYKRAGIVLYAPRQQISSRESDDEEKSAFDQALIRRDLKSIDLLMKDAKKADWKWFIKNHATLWAHEEESAPDFQALLFKAVSEGCNNLVHFLLIEESKDPKIADRDGRTLLHRAAQNGYKDLVQLLITRGAQVTVADTFGITSFHLAAEGGHLEILKNLIDKGPFVNSSDKIGTTPLHLASREGHEDTVRFLLLKGADVKTANIYGTTSLHMAAANGHSTVIEILLEKGANPYVKDKQEKTPLDFAKNDGVKVFLMKKISEKK